MHGTMSLKKHRIAGLQNAFKVAVLIGVTKNQTVPHIKRLCPASSTNILSKNYEMPNERDIASGI